MISRQLKKCLWALFTVLFFIAGQKSAAALDHICCPDLADERWNTNRLYEGIQWKYALFEDLFGSPQYVNLVVSYADTLAGQIVFAAADSILPGTKRMTADEFADSFRSLAVINGGFFTDHPRYVNTGIFKWDGTVYPFLKQESDEIYFVGEGAVGLSKDGEWMFYNREGKAWPDDWHETHSAIAGGHVLIAAGKIRANILNEEYKTDREIRHAGQRHPRTAICLTGSNHILLLVADGRHEEAAGFSLNELAHLLLGFDCVEAVNFDGGGSSTMFIHGEGVVNHPSDNTQFDRYGARAVRTAIVITEPEPGN